MFGGQCDHDPDLPAKLRGLSAALVFFFFFFTSELTFLFVAVVELSVLVSGNRQLEAALGWRK